MIKKSFLLVFALVLGYQAHSQVLIALLFGDKLNSENLEFGINIGPNWTTLSNVDDANYLRNFHVGLYFDIKVNDFLAIRPEVMAKSTMGTTGFAPYATPNDSLNNLLANGQVTRKISYFNMPIMAEFHLPKRFRVMAGPQISLRTKAKDVFEADAIDEKDLVFTNNIKKQMKVFDFGLVGGIGKKLGTGRNGVTVSARYYYGLTDIIKENTGDPQRNSGFYLTFSVPVGGKKAAAESTDLGGSGKTDKEME